jgi:hypothetical protein
MNEKTQAPPTLPVKHKEAVKFWKLKSISVDVADNEEGVQERVPPIEIIPGGGRLNRKFVSVRFQL